MPYETAALWRQAHLTLAAFEQPYPQLLFQRFQTTADSRLRDEKRLCGTAEVACAIEFQKRAEEFEVHGYL
jgi:hypothetical protein